MRKSTNHDRNAFNTASASIDSSRRYGARSRTDFIASAVSLLLLKLLSRALQAAPVSAAPVRDGSVASAARRASRESS